MLGEVPWNIMDMEEALAVFDVFVMEKVLAIHISIPGVIVLTYLEVFSDKS